MNRFSCVRCGQPFQDARPLIPPVFCSACLDDCWDRSVARTSQRRAAWYDGPQVPAAVAPDQFNRTVGAPRLEGFE